ncbi:MAG: alkaline phosphatase family protein [Kofleriaceae bacterium]|nr:alkaline phosphatase family protein [Kofleriaceae bacterium]
MINRRQAIKRIGGLAGLAAMPKFLSACGGENEPVGITTYVYVMLENRTYDHVFGARSWKEGKPGNGLTDGIMLPDAAGNPTPLYEPPNMTAQMCVGHDPDHSWTGSRAQWNSGANDGFLKVHQDEFGAGAMEPLQYLTRKHQPISWALADAYTTCDRWHSSILGPTLPNRFYWHAATSAGYRTNAILSSVSNLEVPTIYHRLRDKNVEWAYYYGSLPVVAALGNLKGEYAMPADYVTPRVRRFGDSELGIGQFFKDAAAGVLPPVTYIDPFFYLNDDHPPSHPLLAQQFISAIYTALAKGPQWKNCMLVITYDEHGGFYDHVSPPKTMDDTLEKFGVDEHGEPATDFDQLGFRVPAMVIGPYVKQGYVSSVQYDHTSALKHLANAFDLESLNVRMDAANDLSDCIDMDRLMRGEPADPIDLPAITVEADDEGNRVSITVGGEVWPWNETECELMGASLRTDPISETADRAPEVFAGYADLRPHAETYLTSIDAFLRKHQR